jgi:hypothetical protein
MVDHIFLYPHLPNNFGVTPRRNWRTNEGATGANAARQRSDDDERLRLRYVGQQTIPRTATSFVWSLLGHLNSDLASPANPQLNAEPPRGCGLDLTSRHFFAPARR